VGVAESLCVFGFGFGVKKTKKWCNVEDGNTVERVMLLSGKT
jgi:hypothetical protein